MTAGTAAETRKSWGARLRAEREQRGARQGDIAVATGIDQATVSNAEAGRAGLETYIRLARHYGITLETPA
jgi:transcriptional regulator with XRE-family HTH domain